jgi:hypothetical protein
LDPGKAHEALDADRRGEKPSGQQHLAGQGDDLDQRIIERLKRELIKVKGKFPDTLRQRDPEGGKFEAEACPIVHRLLPSDAQMLADYDFWTWLAVCACREIVDWRHGGPQRRAVPENFGIGKRDENLLYRMWARANIGKVDGSAEPYRLALRGDQDFWRSHVLRQNGSYGSCRPVVHSLIRFQFPSDSRGSPTLKDKVIRELAKRLRRLNANLLFECMDEKGAEKLLAREAEAAKRAVGQGGD